MASVAGSPTVRSRRLGKELRRLREESGHTCEHVAGLLRCSASRISRIESGEIKVRPGDVYELLELYAVPDEHRHELLEMAKDVRREGWWQRYDDVLPKRYLTYILMESEAREIRAFEHSLVHGLVQTTDYAQAVQHTDPEVDDPNASKRADARIARQAVLDRPGNPLLLHVVMDEAALHRQVGGRDIMREQLRHIVKRAALPNVTIQILPFDRGAHPGMAGSFAIMDFPDPSDRSVGFSNIQVLGERTFERPSEIKELNLVFDQLIARALSPAESIELIAQLADKP
ncbi:MAG: helix-turn-helix domain-containing protein [Mycobacteriales bacterium]|jgi:transcriptional regulator with XRE-family HTH domain